MNEFAHEMTERVAKASSSLDEAQSAGDDYLVEVRLGELESLARVADDHGLEMPVATQTLARFGRVDDHELPDGTASPTGPIRIDAIESERDPQEAGAER